MLILNCGGTFNKRYNPNNGMLEVPFDNDAITKILQSSHAKNNIAGAIYKDSLDMDANDRKMLADIILHSCEDTFVIVHGTDTMDKTAEFFDAIFEDKKIVITGAMRPFEIDNIEATLNLGMACGFAKALEQNGIYICMNGQVAPWNKIKKDTTLGRFELV